MIDSIKLRQYFEQGKYSEIVNTCTENEDFVITDPSISYILAAAYLRLGDYQSAQDICERIEGPFKENDSFLSMYAAVLRRQGLYSRSEEIFKQALAINNSNETKNNYSNLLIDKGEYENARQILSGIVLEEPEYTDACVNLERVKGLMNSVDNKKSQTIDSNNELNLDYNDPIEAAFAVGEVIQCGAKVGDVTSEALNLVDVESGIELEQAELESLQLADELIQKSQNNAALSICNKIRRKKGANYKVYRVASDAYLGIKDFVKAEFYAFQAFTMGDQSVGLKINLCNLAAMRKDFFAAKYWLQEAKAQDPNSDAVEKTEQVVLNNKNKNLESLDL